MSCHTQTHTNARMRIIFRPKMYMSTSRALSFSLSLSLSLSVWVSKILHSPEKMVLFLVWYLWAEQKSLAKNSHRLAGPGVFPPTLDRHGPPPLGIDRYRGIEEFPLPWTRIEIEGSRGSPCPVSVSRSRDSRVPPQPDRYPSILVSTFSRFHVFTLRILGHVSRLTKTTHPTEKG